MQIKTALLTVTDKTGIEEFSKGLNNLGVQLISTGGTAKVIREAGVPCIEVSQLTGVPEMLGGRVKTLAYQVCAGILAKRNNEGDMKELEEHDVLPIDMVVVNLYNFEAAVENPNITHDELIEQIDIGGPTLIRAAAKNWRSVAVVTSPIQYSNILYEMHKHEQLQPGIALLSKTTKWRLAQRAFQYTAHYDHDIAKELLRWDESGNRSPQDVIRNRQGA